MPRSSHLLASPSNTPPTLFQTVCSGSHQHRVVVLLMLVHALLQHPTGVNAAVHVAIAPLLLVLIDACLPSLYPAPSPPQSYDS